MTVSSRAVVIGLRCYISSLVNIRFGLMLSDCLLVLQCDYLLCVCGHWFVAQPCCPAICLAFTSQDY